MMNNNLHIPAPPTDGSIKATIGLTRNAAGKVNVYSSMTDVAKARELYDELENHFWSRVGAANYIALNAMLEAYDAIEEAGMLKQQVKYWAKVAIKASEAYSKEAHSKMGDRYALWSDVVRLASDNLQNDVTHLYYSIKQMLDKYRIPHADICSHIQTAMALLTSAVLFYDGLVEHFQKQTFYNITKDFKVGRLTGVESSWREVARLTSKCKEEINLQEDYNCQLAMRVIFNKYGNMDFLNDAAQKAMPLNPAMAKYANEEDKKYFDPNYQREAI